MRWWIIDFEEGSTVGRLRPLSHLPARPANARPCELLADGIADQYTPYYQLLPHVHKAADGYGAHVRADTLEGAIYRALDMLAAKR